MTRQQLLRATLLFVRVGRVECGRAARRRTRPEKCMAYGARRDSHIVGCARRIGCSDTLQRVRTWRKRDDGGAGA
ncbi:hypothetical protein C2E23DRAFT_823535 [Lenzites betulinus]|nr:hypothetical protein C2E23DRAFT_855197 [Lenzites betulinus]KAH9853176.1 hypothetical protein C2E23DRAFT_823535 [Lenzites betulinus]